MSFATTMITTMTATMHVQLLVGAPRTAAAYSSKRTQVVTGRSTLATPLRGRLVRERDAEDRLGEIDAVLRRLLRSSGAWSEESQSKRFGCAYMFWCSGSMHVARDRELVPARVGSAGMASR
jgi:hypothetical protein